MEQIPKSSATIPTTQTSAERQLAGRMISYISSLPQNNLTWFWQLLANGLDNIDPSTPFILHINFKNNCIEFNHNGKSFTMKNLIAMVNQTTTKNQQLGLGLMSVFKLTPNVQVQGIVVKEGQEGSETFTLELQRPIDSINKLSNQIQNSKSQLLELAKIKETQPLDEGITTRFRLLVNKDFEEDVKEIRNSLIYLFAFNKHLAKIILSYKGETTTYSRPPLEDHKLGCKTMFLYVGNQGVNRLFLLERLSETVALPIHEKNGVYTLQRVKQNQSIWKSYPLNQQVKLPFIVNSTKFELDLTRNQLAKNEINNTILQKAFQILFELLKLTSSSLQQVYLLLSFSLPTQYARLNLSQQYKQFISNQPIIKLFDQSYSSLSRVFFPLVQSSNYVPETFIQLNTEFFRFVNHFLPYPLDQLVYSQSLKSICLDLQDWLPYIKPYTLKQFIVDLSALQTATFTSNIKAMNQYPSLNSHLIVEYMNDFYAFLHKQFPVQLFNPHNKIALNFNYHLKKPKGLFMLSSEIPNEFMEFMFTEFNFDMKDVLLAPGIDKDLFDLNLYDLNLTLDVFVSSFVDKQTLDVIDQIRIFRFISMYSEQDIKDTFERKIVHDLFRNLKIFKDVPEIVTTHSLKINYGLFVQKLIDSVYDKVESSLENIDSLGRLFDFTTAEDIIQWFNDFQALLNRIKYDKIFPRNLNRNGTFQNVSELLSTDPAITSLQISIFNKLPVQISVQDKSANYRYQKIEQILLHTRIDAELFYKQHITHLSVEELLYSMIPKFRCLEDDRDELNEKSEIMLDYCDDLYELYEREPTEELELKVNIMRDIRRETAEALLVLRLRGDEDKEFIWRLMRQRKSFEGLKELRRKQSLEKIVHDANDYAVLTEQYREQNEQIKILRAEREKIAKEWENKVAAAIELKGQELKNLTIKYQGELDQIKEENLKYAETIKKFAETNLLLKQKEENRRDAENQTEIIQNRDQNENVDKEKKISEQLATAKLQEQVERLEQALKVSEKQLQEHSQQNVKLRQKIEDIRQKGLQKENLELVNLKQLCDHYKTLSEKRLQKQYTTENHQQKVEIKQEKKQYQKEIEKKQAQQKIQQKQPPRTLPQHIQKEGQHLVQSSILDIPSNQSSTLRQSNQVAQTKTTKIVTNAPTALNYQDQIPKEGPKDTSKNINNIPEQYQQTVYETLFNELTSSRYYYDKQINCFIVSNDKFPDQKAYLMILSNDKENTLTHDLLNKIYKIKMNLYLGVVPATATTKEELVRSLKIYSLWDLEIDKWYSNLKEAESKKNAAIRAKAGNGEFWFEYVVAPHLKHNIKGRSFEEFQTEIAKNKGKK